MRNISIQRDKWEKGRRFSSLSFHNVILLSLFFCHLHHSSLLLFLKSNFFCTKKCIFVRPWITMHTTTTTYKKKKVQQQLQSVAIKKCTLWCCVRKQTHLHHFYTFLTRILNVLLTREQGCNSLPQCNKTTHETDNLWAFLNLQKIQTKT